jgi:glycine betaine/choline ABC-type transport system substrate-binding protein
MCVGYTTDGSIAAQGFLFLTDDKTGFPQFHPAPIVRTSLLKKYPDIAKILNPLAPKLTTEASIQMQVEVGRLKSGGTSVTEAVKQVAKQFLQRAGLLPSS